MKLNRRYCSLQWKIKTDDSKANLILLGGIVKKLFWILEIKYIFWIEKRQKEIVSIFLENKSYD